MTTTVRLQARRLAQRLAGAASRSQWCVRAIVALAPLAVLLAGTLAGAQAHWWVFALVGAAGLTGAVQPDSHATAVTQVLLVVFWWWSVPSSNGVLVLVAAAAVVALHVAATLAAYGPPNLELGAALVRLWVARGLLLWLLAFAAWATGRLAAPAAVSLVLALVAVAGLTWWAAVRFAAADVPGEV